MGILKTLSLGIFFIGSMATAQNLETTLQVKDKKALSFQDLPRYQLFYFWATWCPDCKEKITSDLTGYQKENVQLIAIATDKDLKKITDYLAENKVAVPVFFDEKKELQKAFKVFSVPTVVLTEKKGTSFQVLQQVSGTDWSEIKLKIKGL